SADAPEHAVDAAVEVARRTGGVVVVSGPTDVVVTTDGVAEKISRGHPFMARVTGTGCLLGALTAGCLVATDDPVQAAVTAVTWFDVAGEVAAARAGGPGTFRVQLLDALDEVARTGVEETR
ncbi:MAG: hydroxyethylthiazole kinase, partial [Cutibacterium avidum]|nr:hydroxyethylthiazole kinase [Cutibacterium avidum]